MRFKYKTTICYILNDKGEVLLQKKRRGFGAGNWNGPGGKKKEDENFRQCAKREVAEETEIIVGELEERGEIEFIFPHNPGSNNYSRVFVARDYKGDPRDTGEGDLKWFKIKDIPLDEMWDDDRYWLPAVLRGGTVKKRFFFDKDDKIEKQEDL